MPIYDAAMRYKREGVPLIVFGGKEYGMGSSRDWAAKGTMLLGIRAVIAESFERIHRSNLVGMGVLPLTFKDGTTRKSLDLAGDETIDIAGLDKLSPRMDLTVRHPPQQRPDRRGSRHLPRRYHRRGRLLPARRHPALRPARHGPRGLIGGEGRPGSARTPPGALPLDRAKGGAFGIHFVC